MDGPDAPHDDSRYARIASDLGRGRVTEEVRSLTPGDAAGLIGVWNQGFLPTVRRKGFPLTSPYGLLCGQVFTAQNAVSSGALADACEHGDIAAVACLLKAGALRPAEGGADPEGPQARDVLEMVATTWRRNIYWTYERDYDLSPAQNAAAMAQEEEFVDQMLERIRLVADALLSAGVPPTQTALRIIAYDWPGKPALTGVVARWDGTVELARAVAELPRGYEDQWADYYREAREAREARAGRNPPN